MPILEYTASGNILLFCNFFVVHFQEVIHQQSFTVTLGQLFQGFCQFIIIDTNIITAYVENRIVRIIVVPDSQIFYNDFWKFTKECFFLLSSF